MAYLTHFTNTHHAYELHKPGKQASIMMSSAKYCIQGVALYTVAKPERRWLNKEVFSIKAILAINGHSKDNKEVPRQLTGCIVLCYSLDQEGYEH